MVAEVGAGLEAAVDAALGGDAFRAGSNIVPHIPQNRKLLELTSPHLGQITDSPISSIQCTSETRARRGKMRRR
jgi:hypothetical protein